MLEVFAKLFAVCLLTLVMLWLAISACCKLVQDSMPNQYWMLAILLTALIGIAAGDLAVWLL